MSARWLLKKSRSKRYITNDCARLFSLYQNYVEQLMTEQEYVTLKARYKAEAEEAERLIATLEQEQRENEVYTAENRFLTEFCSFMGTDTLTKEMASALVERIYIGADKTVDIRLRYRDEYCLLYTSVASVRIDRIVQVTVFTDPVGRGIFNRQQHPIRQLPQVAAV